MKYFKLFACCQIVKGACRSIIIDIQRNTFETIPNDLFDLINDDTINCEDGISSMFNIESQSVINDYVSFLIKNEYGFWCDSKKELNCFPKMNSCWEIPYKISNIIIDVGESIELDYLDILKQVHENRIPYVQIRSMVDKDFSFYEALCESILKSNIISIDFFIPFPPRQISDKFLKKFVRENLRIKSLVFHGAPFNKVINVIEYMAYISFVKKQFTSVLDCGNIRFKNFVTNQDLYLESLNYNSCLNRKVSIDNEGEIKNCPALNKSFGNIRRVKLSTAIQKNKNFLWSIKKDDIDVCKDCEFRYVCIDCRAIIKDPSNILSQPAKCNYNPYIAKWKGEKGFISVKKWRKQNT